MDSGIPAAGWYDDFEDQALLRYWDGAAWTGHVQPRAAPTPPPAAPPPPQQAARPTWTQPGAGYPAETRLTESWAAENWPAEAHPAQARPAEARPSREPVPMAGWTSQSPAPTRRVRPFRVALVVALLLMGIAGTSNALRHATDPLTPASDTPPSATPPLAEPDVGPTAVRCASESTRGVVLPKALTATRPAGRPVITPAGAEQVLQELWTAREQALATCDLPTLHALDTGSARIGDVARTTCSCLIRVADPYTESRIFVPRQLRYPAYFVALAQTETTRGETWLEVMAFTRSSAESSWQLSLSTGFFPNQDLGDWPQPIADTNGYATRPDAATRTMAASMPSQLAAYYQKAKDTGKVPAGPFEPGSRTTDTAKEIAEHRQNAVQGNRLRGHFTYTAAKDPPFLVLVRDQVAMACGVVRVRSVYTQYRGRYPYQTTDRLNWGYNLAPGKYRSVTSAGVMQTCFMIQTTGEPPLVLGGDYLAESTKTGIPLD